MRWAWRRGSRRRSSPMPSRTTARTPWTMPRGRSTPSRRSTARQEKSTTSSGRPGASRSARRAGTFHIDTVAPVTLAQVAGTLAGDGSYFSSVTVTLTASDATSGVQSEQYRVDGGPSRTYSVPFTLGGNGTHMLDYFATDVAGSAESVRGLSIRITGDSHVLPVSTLSSSGVTRANGWYVSPVTLLLSATCGSGVGPC